MFRGEKMLMTSSSSGSETSIWSLELLSYIESPISARASFDQDLHLSVNRLQRLEFDVEGNSVDVLRGQAFFVIQHNQGVTDELLVLLRDLVNLNGENA